MKNYDVKCITSYGAFKMKSSKKSDADKALKAAKANMKYGTHKDYKFYETQNALSGIKFKDPKEK